MAVLSRLLLYSTKLFAPRRYGIRRPNSTFGAVTDIFSGVTSNYQALSVQANHRMNHHMQFSANYTWSHALDNGVNGTTFTATNSLLDPFNLSKEYGNSIYNVPQRFVVNAVIESPWHFNGFTKWLANDWQISPILQVQSGLPYSAFVSGSAPNQTAGNITVSGINGSGGTNRLDIGRNTFTQPATLISGHSHIQAFPDPRALQPGIDGRLVQPSERTEHNRCEYYCVFHRLHQVH